MPQSKEYHEQRLRAAIDRRTHAEPGSINYHLPPQFISCSDDGLTCTVRYALKPEMRNPIGWLHGGVTSTMMDMTMGLLVYYNADFTLCPTASITVNFLRPGRIGGALIIQSEITFRGHKIFHTAARAWMEDAPDHLVATATASYMVTRPSKSDLSDSESGKSRKK